MASPRAGYYGPFGGRFVAETLVPALDELARAFDHDRPRRRVPARVARRSSRSYVGRPTPLGEADAPRARRRPGRHVARAPLAEARGPLPHRRAQDQQRPRPGAARQEDGQDAHHRRDRRRPARRRDGDGVRALRPPVRGLHGRRGREAPGAERRPHEAARRAGHPRRERLAHAEGRDERGAARLGHQRARRRTTASAAPPGPHPYPELVATLPARHRRGGARADRSRSTGALPDAAVACVGGGSNAIGLFRGVLGDAGVALFGVEAAGDGVATGKHAATLPPGRVGVLHGSKSYVLCDDGGQILEAHSISAGLDYPGVGPEHAWLKDTRPRDVPLGDRRRGARRGRRSSRGPRASSPRSRRRTRSRASATSRGELAAKRGRPVTLVARASPAAATRTSRRSSRGSTWSA